MDMGISEIAAIATIGSSAVSALGAMQQSGASAAAAGYNSQIAARNAQIQTQNAAFAGAKGEQETGAAGAKTRAEMGALLANQGASGVDINTGSNVDVRESESKLGMLNALTIRSNAVKEAYGYQVGATSDQAQAALLKKQQGYDTESGYYTAGANLLGGIGKASQYTRWLNGHSSPTGNLTGDPLLEG